jgi:hypothetical protein
MGCEAPTREDTVRGLTRTGGARSGLAKFPSRIANVHDMIDSKESRVLRELGYRVGAPPPGNRFKVSADGVVTTCKYRAAKP